MERFRDVVCHTHELVIRGGQVHAPRCEVGPYSIVQTKRERYRGIPDKLFRGERFSFGKLRHDVDKREDEAAQTLLGWSGS